MMMAVAAIPPKNMPTKEDADIGAPWSVLSAGKLSENTSHNTQQYGESGF